MIWFLLEIFGFYIKKICVKSLNDIIDTMTIFSQFCEGPTAVNSSFVSKIFQKKGPARFLALIHLIVFIHSEEEQ